MLRRLFLPRLCFLCRQHNAATSAVCRYCQQMLPYLDIHSLCQSCGISLGLAEHPYCGRCLQHPPQFDRCVPLLPYDTYSAYLITRLKFHAQFATLKVLSQLWIPYLQQQLRTQSHSLPMLLIPIPLHTTRLRQRGFNQSILLAKQLGAALHIPVNTTLLHKTKATRAQAELSAKQREHNLKNAFMVHGTVPRHVVLIDDVMTTGATANEAARVLKNAGAESVEVWCVARAG